MVNRAFINPIDKGVEMSEIKLDVSGMTCGSCVKHVTNALKPLDGVEDVSVDLATGKVKVTRATDKADDLIAALVEDGYPAQLDVGGAPQVKQGGDCIWRADEL